MNYKQFLPLLLIFQVACSNTAHDVSHNQANKNILKESAVKTLLDGTFIVRKTDNTPQTVSLMNDKYFQYYSGLHANSIGCKSYSQVQLKLNKNEKAYKCMVNGTYLTKNSIAIGTPWR